MALQIGGSVTAFLAVLAAVLIGSAALLITLIQLGATPLDDERREG